MIWDGTTEVIGPPQFPTLVLPPELKYTLNIQSEDLTSGVSRATSAAVAHEGSTVEEVIEECVKPMVEVATESLQPEPERIREKWFTGDIAAALGRKIVSEAVNPPSLKTEGDRLSWSLKNAAITLAGGRNSDRRRHQTDAENREEAAATAAPRGADQIAYELRII